MGLKVCIAAEASPGGHSEMAPNSMFSVMLVKEHTAMLPICKDRIREELVTSLEGANRPMKTWSTVGGSPRRK